MRRLGIIGSTNGSALIAADDCLKAAGKKTNWVVVTDRDCGLEGWAKSNGHELHRVTYSDADSFSRRAHRVFLESDCSHILLFYSRLIAPPLIDEMQVWNIHPALLPAFAGLGTIEKSMKAGVRIFGATLHRVDAGVDTGAIVAQVAAALQPGISVDRVQRLSYLQKVWLTLVWYEQLAPGIAASPRLLPDCQAVKLSYPGLADRKLLQSYNDWLAAIHEDNHHDSPS